MYTTATLAILTALTIGCSTEVADESVDNKPTRAQITQALEDAKLEADTVRACTSAECLAYKKIFDR